MVTRWMRLAVVSFVLVLAGAVAAGAQPLGTFRWQQRPYCNILTLNVVQSGDIYHLDGYDDQCGAARRASVVGIAFLNPDGSVGIGLTLVTTPGGAPLHFDVTLSLATISGTWRSAGDNGPFVLTPGAGVPGSPRPNPPIPPLAKVDRPFHAFVVCPAATRFAVVEANGTFDRGSAGTSATRLTTGTYVVTFNIDVSNCSWQVTVGQTGSVGATTGVGNVAGRSGNVNALFITTMDIQ